MSPQNCEGTRFYAFGVQVLLYVLGIQHVKHFNYGVNYGDTSQVNNRS